MATVGIVGTLDTKGQEFAYLKERIEAAGADTLVINTGVLEEPFFAPDVAAEEVAAAGGSSRAALLEERDRGRAVAAMSFVST
jgi:uncharacterized protein (UPF0261 family)